MLERKSLFAEISNARCKRAAKVVAKSKRILKDSQRAGRAVNPRDTNKRFFYRVLSTLPAGLSAEISASATSAATAVFAQVTDTLFSQAELLEIAESQIILKQSPTNVPEFVALTTAFEHVAQTTLWLQGDVMLGQASRAAVNTARALAVLVGIRGQHGVAKAAPLLANQQLTENALVMFATAFSNSAPHETLCHNQGHNRKLSGVPFTNAFLVPSQLGAFLEFTDSVLAPVVQSVRHRRAALSSDELLAIGTGVRGAVVHNSQSGATAGPYLSLHWVRSVHLALASFFHVPDTAYDASLHRFVMDAVAQPVQALYRSSRHVVLGETVDFLSLTNMPWIGHAVFLCELHAATKDVGKVAVLRLAERVRNSRPFATKLTRLSSRVITPLPSPCVDLSLQFIMPCFPQ